MKAIWYEQNQVVKRVKLEILNQIKRLGACFIICVVVSVVTHHPAHLNIFVIYGYSNHSTHIFKGL